MRAMIKGTPVRLAVRTQIGTDDFSRPIYTDEFKTVDNVLIGEPSTEDVTNEMNISGKRIAYTLGIPKGNTDKWDNTFVEFFGERFCTIGTATQGIDDNIPLSWNKKVKVERYVTED